MPCYQYYAEQLSTMIFCSFEARYRVINSLFKCLIPRRGRHWSLSSRTLIDRPSSSEANILLSSSQNRFVCLDLTHSHITRRCVAVFAKKVNFVFINCLHILSILSDHACIARSFMCMPLEKVTFYSITFTQHEQKWSAGKCELG